MLALCIRAEARPFSSPPSVGRGFADSKTLNEEKRDKLFEAIQREKAAGQGGCLGHAADVLSAAFI